MARPGSIADIENKIEYLTETIYNGWEAVKSCSADIVGADSAVRVSEHGDRYRMLQSIKACSEELLERYNRRFQLYGELDDLNRQAEFQKGIDAGIAARSSQGRRA